MKVYNILLSIVFLILTSSFLLVSDIQFSDGIHNFEGVDSENSTAIIQAAILPIVMLIGIISGELYSLFSNKSDNKITMSDFTAVFSRKSLWKSLLASPIVFGMVYSMSSNQTDIVMSLLFAFENGFFCNLVLTNRKKEFETSPNNG